MDFIEEQLLADRMQRGPLTMWEELEIVRETALAAHYGHERWGVHCDVKPANILLDAEGRVKVVDSGIAEEFDKEEMSLTIEGYMSLEQLSGKTVIADRW